MRQIKFRGISTKTGKYVYGYYVPQCPMSSFPGIVDDDGFINEVEPDSVAQLVGTDINGKEVYEGDIVYLGGKDYQFCVTISTSRSIVARSTLKEANHGR